MAKEERNLKVVQAYWEAFNRGDVLAALALFNDPVLNNGREVPRAFVAKKFEDMRVRTPDISFKTEEIVAINEHVIVRGEYSGTHLGIAHLPVDGGLLVGVPPTGKKLAVQHIHWFKLKDGVMENTAQLAPTSA